MSELRQRVVLQSARRTLARMLIGGANLGSRKTAVRLDSLQGLRYKKSLILVGA